MEPTPDTTEAEIRSSLQRDLNMSKYQSQVYFSLVRGGKQTMRELAERSEVPKQRVYDVVEELRNRGFVELNESYPKQAYAVEPSEPIGPIQEQLGTIRNRLEAMHQTASDFDSGIAQFRSRSTIKKYVAKLLASSQRTVFLLTSVERFDLFEEELRALEDVQVRIIVSGLDGNRIKEGEITLNRPISEIAASARGMLQSEPFILCVDRTEAFFWPSASAVDQQTQEGFYVTDEELAFVFDRFLSDTIWPVGYPIQGAEERSEIALPTQYFRIRDCLTGLQRIADEVPIDALEIVFDGVERLSGAQVTREGTLAGYYRSKFDDSAYLEVDVRNDSSVPTPNIVTVGGWKSQRADYRAEHVTLRASEDWSPETLAKETKTQIIACEEALPKELSSKSVLVGFDGYIDHIRRLVGERKNPRMYDEIDEFDTFREMLARSAAKDKTLQFEWVESERLPGGHTSHLGQALNRVGYDSQLVGYFGHPIREEFSDEFAESDLLSIGQPTVTEYLQFKDGKVMFTESGTHQVLNWETLREYVPPEKFANYLNGAQLMSIGGWALITEISSIWEGIHEQVYPLLSSPPENILICASETQHLKETTMRSDMESLHVLDGSIPVTLVMSAEQVKRLEEVFLPDDTVQRSLRNRVELLRRELEISRLAITSENESVLVTSDEQHRVGVPSELRSEGTFEDHFAAGIALGLGEELSEQSTLVLGNVLASYFKQYRRPPSYPELRSFLDEHANGSDP